MIRKVRGFSGTKDPIISERELKNRELAREAAGEGMVLLKNENHFLPLKEGQKIALFGSGATRTIKGGTGSGDVNERESVSVYQGLVNAGFDITSKEWLTEYEEVYKKARNDWKETILREVEISGARFFQVYSSHAFHLPAGRRVDERDKDEQTDTAVLVISRIAGEGADRTFSVGDYLLTEEEKENVRSICRLFTHVALVLNTGAQIDLSILDEYANIESVIYMVQAGMEGGNALADILLARRAPSGKLTATWAANYGDYPKPSLVKENDPDKDYYPEGIYVGYRWFDKKEIVPRFAFGFGLGYTEFSR